jgi:hypothetical protein
MPEFELLNREYLEEIVIANNPVDRMDLIDLDLVDLLDMAGFWYNTAERAQHAKRV